MGEPKMEGHKDSESHTHFVWDSKCEANSAFSVFIYSLLCGITCHFMPKRLRSKHMQTEHRKCTLLISVILTIILYDLCHTLVALLRDAPFNQFNYLVLCYGTMFSFLLLWLRAGKDLFKVTIMFVVLADSGLFLACIMFASPTEYHLWMVFLPLLVFFIFGSKAGVLCLLGAMVQGFLILAYSSHFPPLMTVQLHPWEKLFAINTSFFIIGLTAFVNEFSKCMTLRRLCSVLDEVKQSNIKLQEATNEKTRFVANLSHGVCTLIPFPSSLLFLTQFLLQS